MLLFGVKSISKGQTFSDSVFVKKNFWGHKFYHSNTRLNLNQLPHIMLDNSEAHLLISKAKNKNTASAIISGIGGFIVGWQLGTEIAGGEANWNLAAVGGGLILISIPISSKSHKQTLKAIEIYNAGLAADGKRPQLILCSTGNGIGLKLEF